MSQQHPPSAVQAGALVHAIRLGRQSVARTSRNSLRPADAEQLRRALADHKDACSACRANRKCDMARRLEKALNG